MKSLILITLSFVFFAGVSVGQEKQSDNMSILIEKIKADKKLLVAENMGLTEAEAKGFWPLYEAYQKDLHDLQAKYGKLLERYAENYKSMTDAQAKEIIDEYLKMEQEALKIRETHLPKFRGVLSEIKVARYYQIENKIRAAINYELAALIPLVK